MSVAFAKKICSRGSLVVAALVVIITIASLTPMPEWEGEGGHVFSVLPQPSVHSWIDFGENILFYLPLGLALGAQGIQPVKAIGASATLSLTLESLQFFIPGRDPSASDLLANTLGAMIGIWVMRRRSRVASGAIRR